MKTPKKRKKEDKINKWFGCLKLLHTKGAPTNGVPTMALHHHQPSSQEPATSINRAASVELYDEAQRMFGQLLVVARAKMLRLATDPAAAPVL